MKRLIDFLQPSTVLEDDLTSRQIQIVLEERKLAAAASLVTPEKPFHRKKDIKLKPWNGEGDTIHPWRDAVDSISDPSFYDKDPDSSQQVFYALCEALKGGSAHHYAKDVETVTGRKCAHDLMEKLLTTFNTEESNSPSILYWTTTSQWKHSSQIGNLLSIDSSKMHQSWQRNPFFESHQKF